jgi:hypothetical protein
MDSRPPSTRLSRPLPTPQRIPAPLAPMDEVPNSASAYSQAYSRQQSYAPQSAFSMPPESNAGFSNYDNFRDDFRDEEALEEMEIESHMGVEPTYGGVGGGYGRSAGEPLEGINEHGMGMQALGGMRDLTGTGAAFGGMRLDDIRRDNFSPNSFTEGKKKNKSFVGGFFTGLRRFPSKLVKRKKKFPPPSERMPVNLDDPQADMYADSGMGTNTDMDRGRTMYDQPAPLASHVGGFVPPPLPDQEVMLPPRSPPRSPPRRLVPPPVTVVDYDTSLAPGAATTMQLTPTSHHSHHSGASHRSHRHSDDRLRDEVTSDTHDGAGRTRTRADSHSTNMSRDTTRPLRGKGNKFDDSYKYRRPSTHESHSVSGRGSSSASASTTHRRRPLSTVTDDSLPPTRLGNMRRAIRGFKRMPWVASTRITSDYRPDISSSRSRSQPALEAKRRQQGLPKKGESWYRPSPEQLRRMRDKEDARREKRRRRRRAMGLDSRGSTTTDAMSHSHRSHSPRPQQPIIPYGFLPPPGLPPMAVPGSPPTPSIQNLLASSPYAYGYGGQPMYLLPQTALQQVPPLPAQPIPGAPAPPQPAANAASRMSRSISSATRNKMRPLSSFIPGSSSFGLGRSMQAPPAPPQLTTPQAMYLVPGSALMGGMGQLPQYQPGFVPQQAQPAVGAGAADLKRGSSSRQGGNGGGPPSQSWVEGGQK